MTAQKHKSMYTPVEEEVDAIRDRIWEETKGMSPAAGGHVFLYTGTSRGDAERAARRTAAPRPITVLLEKE
jgi:hypothetical protein